MKLELKEVITERDAAELAPLVSSIWREVFPPIIGEAQVEYMLTHYQSAEDIARELRTGAKYFFVLLNGEAIGYLAYEIRAEYLFISKIYLKIRGKGLSSQLFDLFEDAARANGLSKLHLHVNKGNTQAIEVYKHKGFVIVDQVDTDIGEGYVMDDYYMEKSV